MKTYLEDTDCEVLPYLPCLPDTAPSDYHLFQSMQSALSGELFTSYDDIKNWLDNWIASEETKSFLRLIIFSYLEILSGCSFGWSILRITLNYFSVLHMLSFKSYLYSPCNIQTVKGECDISYRSIFSILMHISTQ